MENPLARFRHERGLTQAEAAILFNTHFSHISRVEGGHARPSRSLLKQLAERGVNVPAFILEWRGFVMAKRAAIAERVTENGKLAASSADNPEV